MRIVAIDPHPDNRRGGQERSLFDVLTGLRGRGHEVRLAYVQEGNFLPRYEEAGVRCFRIERTWVERKKRVREWKELLRSKDNVVFDGAEVIYANQFSDLPVACLAGRHRHVPVVCHLRLPPMQYGLQHRACLRLVRGYIVASDVMRQAYAAAGWPADRLHVVPNAFSFPAAAPPWPRDISRPLRMVCLGRITETKGLDTALEIVERLLAQDVPVTLDICGPVLRDEHRVYRDMLLNRIETQGLPARVLDPVQGPLAFLAHYDLSLFPSRWESFGRVVVESIMAGVPVVARDIGAVSDVLGPVGCRWRFRTAEEAVQLVKALIEDPEDYPMSAIYSRAKDYYAKDVILPQIEDIFRHACAMGLSGRSAGPLTKSSS